MADSIAQLASSINSLSFKLECFDGSPNYLPEKFVKDFKQFLIATGRVSKPFIIDKATKRLIPNPEKGILEKQILRTYLKGEAKSWFNLLPDETPYETVLTELIERFKLTKNLRSKLQKTCANRMKIILSAHVISETVGLLPFD